MVWSLKDLLFSASQSRAGGRIHKQHLAERNSLTEKGKGTFGYELRAGRGIPHKWPFQKIVQGCILASFPVPVFAWQFFLNHKFLVFVGSNC